MKNVIKLYKLKLSRKTYRCIISATMQFLYLGVCIPDATAELTADCILDPILELTLDEVFDCDAASKLST